VILAAENNLVEVPVRLDPQVVVGIAAVPPQRVRDEASGNTTCDDITGIERELGLEQCRPSQSAQADEWVVCRQHDVVAAHRVTGGLYCAGFMGEFVGGRVLVDPTAGGRDRLCDACEIRSRMNARLRRESNPWPAEERHCLEVLGVESQFTRERRILLETGCLLIRAPALRSMEVSINPLEVGIDGLFVHDLVDRANGGQPGVPDGLCVVASEAVDQFGDARVRHHREVRARVPGICLRAPVALEHHDSLTGLG
jgi:hypothetical protein